MNENSKTMKTGGKVNHKRGPKPRVTFDGRTYVCKSYGVQIPALDQMTRFGALIWIGQNTYPTGYSRVTNPLAGFGKILSLSTK